MSKLQDTLEIEEPLEPNGAGGTQKSIDDDYKNFQIKILAPRGSQKLNWRNYEKYHLSECNF